MISIKYALLSCIGYCFEPVAHKQLKRFLTLGYYLRSYSWWQWWIDVLDIASINCVKIEHLFHNQSTIENSQRNSDTKVRLSCSCSRIIIRRVERNDQGQEKHRMHENNLQQRYIVVLNTFVLLVVKLWYILLRFNVTLKTFSLCFLSLTPPLFLTLTFTFTPMVSYDLYLLFILFRLTLFPLWWFVWIFG